MRGLLYIMRGVPGSGKSTLAATLGTNFSADAIIEALPGLYTQNWNRERCDRAHAICRWKVWEAMKKGITPLVIDNINISRKLALPYAKMAKEWDYEVEIRESNTPWWLEIAKLLKGEVLKYPRP